MYIHIYIYKCIIYIYTYTYNNNILYTKEIAFIFSPFTKLAATDGTSFSPGALLGPLPPSQVVGPRCIPKPDAFFSVVVGKTKSGKDGQASVQKKMAQMLHVWKIYLQNWAIFRANVGNYSSTMEHLGGGLVNHPK